MRAVTDVGGFELVVDEPVTQGGGGSGPQPTDLLLASIGSCVALSHSLRRQETWCRAPRPGRRGHRHLRRARVRAHRRISHLADPPRGAPATRARGRARLLCLQHATAGAGARRARGRVSTVATRRLKRCRADHSRGSARRRHPLRRSPRYLPDGHLLAGGEVIAVLTREAIQLPLGFTLSADSSSYRSTVGPVRPGWALAKCRSATAASASRGWCRWRLRPN